jgi:hypothetical protein
MAVFTQPNRSQTLLAAIVVLESYNLRLYQMQKEAL